MSFEKECFEEICKRMKALADTDEGYASMFNLMIDRGLDELLEDNAFGTEGQCDPRGDARDCGYPSVWNMIGFKPSSLG